VLRRRPDARWRVTPDDVDTLAGLQRDALAAAADLVRVDGRVVYSVCTMTAAETVDVDEWLAESRPDLVADPPPAGPWEPLGRGAILLPQTADTDGMFVLGLHKERRVA
jgi:16S rRNA (cytosine967-C5)-methyltransferase